MTTPQQIGLFEGYGGLTQAVEEVLGAELIAYSEIDPAACRLLAHHHPGVPNLGDITTIDWDQLERDIRRSLILTGGFPCQDLSLAGIGAGLRPGTRSGLWSQMAYAIDRLRPDLVVIENVRGLLSADAACDLEPCPWCLGDDEGRPLRALGAVLGDLAELGYDARWIGLRAADVGAPHGRFRIFIAAWPAADTHRDAVREQPVAECWSCGAPQPGHAGTTAGHTDSGDRDGWATAGFTRETGPEVGPVADADSVGRERGRSARDGRGGSAHDDLAAAHAGDDGCGQPGASGPRPDEPGPAGDPGPAPANTSSVGRNEGWAEPARLGGGSDAAVSGDGAAADAGRDGREGCAERDLGPEGGQPASLGGDAAGRVLEWGAYGPAIERWELILGRPAPAPTQTGKRGGQQLSPRFVEWLMGLPDGYVTDEEIGLTRNEQLARLGNGVVPQQAAAALRYLLGAA